MFWIKKIIIYIFLLLTFGNCTYWPLANGLLASLLEETKANSNIFLLGLIGSPSSTVNLDYIYFDNLSSSITIGQSLSVKTFAKMQDGSLVDLSSNKELLLSSNNVAIFSVDNSVVNGISSGSAVLNAEFKNKIISQSITVGGTINPILAPDTTPPSVSRVVSYGPNVVRVIFSEPVSSPASTLSNYKIALASDVSGTCNDNSNFSTSLSTVGTLGSPTATTLGFNLQSITTINPTTYSITLSHNQNPGARYTLIVDKTNIQDLATTPNPMGCSNSGDFIGDEPIKLISASCVDTTNIALTFSKPVLSGSNIANSGECDTTTSPSCIDQYKLPNSLGVVNFAKRMDGTVCGGSATDTSMICINHSLPQSGASYMVLTANAASGDGFDNLAAITIKSDTIPATSLKVTDDRATFAGCGTVPLNLADGPLLDDPFGDGTNYGDLTSYLSKVLIGPNKSGSFAISFQPDGSSPLTQSFQFIKDTTSSGSRTAQNFFGGLAAAAGFNYSSIGRTGCLIDAGSYTNGCGPNNQDGRGLFQSGLINGIEYLILTGSKAAFDRNDYAYITSDSDNILDFNYIDLGQLLDNPSVDVSGFAGLTKEVTYNKGSESILVHNNNIYFSIPATDPKKPIVVRLQSPTISEPAPSLINKELSLFSMTNIGWFGQNVSNSDRNYHDILGGTLYSFNNKIYFGNTGNLTFETTNCSGNASSIASGVCFQKGGIIRSTVATPSGCTGFGNCADWVDISPSGSTQYTKAFSNPIRSIVDLNKANRPIPDFETFNGNLYFIRNACDEALMFNIEWWSGGNDKACPVGKEKPQLWKCVPSTTGSMTDCDSGDWSIVAENGITARASNMGDTNNLQVTLLKTNGSRLYIGYNNPNGIQVYRTKVGITNPSIESDFELVPGPTGANSFASQFVKEIYSSVSLISGSIYNLYISVGGKNGATPIPVRVYRQINN